MRKRVSVDIAGHIARVSLNRPDKHNALDRGMLEALIDAGEALSHRRAIRAVVLAGEGESFCAGIDISVFGADAPAFDPQDMAPRGDSGANFYQTAALIWRELQVPVIAAVHGAVFGAGLQIALGADLRIASADSRWSIMEIRWGIVPDMGLSVTARGLVPPDCLKRLAFTGAVIDGVTARQLGLVTELHERPLEAALGLAREISARSPDAIRAFKSLIDESRAGRKASLRREAALQLALLGSANQVAAVRANLEGGEALFDDAGS